MNLSELKAQVALGEDSRRQLKHSIIRNPILVSYIAKGLLPYRGLGSGIKRALEDWPQIEFSDDREGNLFTATVHRKEMAVSPEIESGSEESSEKRVEKSMIETKSSLKSSPKSSLKSSLKTEEQIIVLIMQEPTISTEQIGVTLGISKRAVLKQVQKLKAQGRLQRIGPDKGGHWEVIE